MQWRAFGDKVGILSGLGQHHLGRDIGIEELRGITDMQDADNLVDIAFEQRKTCIAILANAVGDLLNTTLYVDTVDLIARHHDVVNGDIFQLQNT